MHATWNFHHPRARYRVATPSRRTEPSYDHPVALPLATVRRPDSLVRAMTAMERLQNSPIFVHIRNARSFPEQAAALRSLKNDLTGHVQRKEKWVECGVLEPIVAILRSARAPVSRNERDFRGAVAHARQLSDEEQVRLEALQLLSIFANGKNCTWRTIRPPPPRPIADDHLRRTLVSPTAPSCPSDICHPVQYLPSRQPFAGGSHRAASLKQHKRGG